jgi:hypothetical protein
VPDRLTLYLRLLAEFPLSKVATAVEVVVPLPRCVQRARCETGALQPGGGRAGGFGSCCCCACRGKE